MNIQEEVELMEHTLEQKNEKSANEVVYVGEDTDDNTKLINFLSQTPSVSGAGANPF